MILSMIRSGSVDIISAIVYIISSLMVIFLVMPLHEWAHGFVAYKLGDRTAKLQGRLTLNPLAHVDYIGAAMILLIGFGWAKPVPVDPRYFKKPKRDMALTALAGPVSNLLAAIVSGLIFNIIMTILIKTNAYYSIEGSAMLYVLSFFYYLMMINVSLAVFNFIPIPPLDGSKILMAFLPDKAVIWILQRERYLSLGLFILIMLGGLNGVLTVANNFFYGIVSWLTYLPFSWAF